MITEQILGLSLALLLMAIGCAGSVLPAIPSTPLVLIAAVAHKLYFGPASAGWLSMTMIALITALALIMDYLATIYGARKFGAGKKGMAGAVIGGLIGLWFNLPGIILGPFVGATLFELLGGRELKPAMRAGMGATMGLFAGALGKLFCCVAMMTLFTASVLWHSLQR